MMLSNILQSLFGTINGIYLGQMIGVEALAAVSVFFPVMFFFISFIIGLGAGVVGADRPGLGRARARQGQGDRRHHAGAGLARRLCDRGRSAACSRAD